MSVRGSLQVIDRANQVYRDVAARAVLRRLASVAHRRGSGTPECQLGHERRRRDHDVVVVVRHLHAAALRVRRGHPGQRPSFSQFNSRRRGIPPTPRLLNRVPV